MQLAAVFPGQRQMTLQILEDAGNEGVIAVACDHVTGVGHVEDFKCRQLSAKFCNAVICNHIAAQAADQ